MATNEAVGSIEEIWRFPVKSMGGEQLAEVELSSIGISGDRRFALRDGDSGKILSAKQPSFGQLLLECSAAIRDGVVTITVADNVFRVSQRDDANAVLSELLGRRVQIEEATIENNDVYESYWPEIEGVALSNVTTDLPTSMMTEKGTFVDLAALHLVTDASLRHLHFLAPNSVITTKRFRPSVLIHTEGEGFVENDWVGRSARLGTAEIAIGSASPRCVMTTIAQGELPRDLSVLQTLAKHNRLGFEGFGNFACLGVYAEVTTPGLIRTGDELILQ